MILKRVLRSHLKTRTAIESVTKVFAFRRLKPKNKGLYYACSTACVLWLNLPPRRTKPRTHSVSNLTTCHHAGDSLYAALSIGRAASFCEHLEMSAFVSHSALIRVLKGHNSDIFDLYVLIKNIISKKAIFGYVPLRWDLATPQIATKDSAGIQRINGGSDEQDCP